jgi:hypothetical protein
VEWVKILLILVQQVEQTLVLVVWEILVVVEDLQLVELVDRVTLQ